jgi:ubiquinone/menaquinone biosynthesis C-methylase UbiE
VRRGEPVLAVNDQHSGAPFFENFVEALFPVNAPSAGVLARHLVLANDASVLDVAAGSGVWGVTLAKSARGVRVTAVDWPSVLEVTRRVAASHGVANRFTFAPGDLLEAEFGDGHQVATLGHIMHTEGEERSHALLRRAQAALAPGGRIAIAEFLVNDGRTGPLNGLVFALNVLVHSRTGGTYSAEEIGLWLREAGFSNVYTLDVPGPAPLVLAER